MEYDSWNTGAGCEHIGDSGWHYLAGPSTGAFILSYYVKYICFIKKTQLVVDKDLPISIWNDLSFCRVQPFLVTDCKVSIFVLMAGLILLVLLIHMGFCGN